MENYFTNEALIQFIYGECGAREAALIKKKIMENAEFAKEYRSYQRAINDLEVIHEEPSQTSIDIILNYAMEGVDSPT